MTVTVSHSGMQTFRKCPHKYYLGRVEGIEPVGKNRAPSFGSAGHEALEKYWEGYDLSVVLAQWWKSVDNWGLDHEDFVLGECLLIGYFSRYLQEDAVYRGGGCKVEGDFDVLVNGLPVKGRKDVETDLWVMDHKFTASNVTPTYIKNLQRSPQAEEYLVATQKEGGTATYAIWDIIKSNRVKRRLATPPDEQQFYTKRGKWGEVGDPKKGTYLVDETWREYRERIVADIAANPDLYFKRIELRKTEEELQRRTYDMWACAKQINRAHEDKAFPRNEAGCGEYGGCEFAPICWDGVDPMQSELYQINNERKR